MQTVREHQPFTLSYVENNLPTTWLVTFDSIACGTAPFSPAVIRADEAATGQPYAMPTAPAGQQFCLIKLSVVNQSHSSQPWSASEATLNVGMNAYRYHAIRADSTSKGKYLGEWTSLRRGSWKKQAASRIAVCHGAT